MLLSNGLFWKPEEKFKTQKGIINTEVGYAGGYKSKVTYEEVCQGNTGHAEIVKLSFDENVISYEKILELFLNFMTQHKKICNFQMLELNIEVKYFMKMNNKKK